MLRRLILWAFTISQVSLWTLVCFQALYSIPLVYLSIFARPSCPSPTPHPTPPYFFDAYLESQPTEGKFISFHSHLENLDSNVSLINFTVKSTAESYVCSPQNKQPSPGEKYPHMYGPYPPNIQFQYWTGNSSILCISITSGRLLNVF